MSIVWAYDSSQRIFVPFFHINSFHIQVKLEFVHSTAAANRSLTNKCVSKILCSLLWFELDLIYQSQANISQHINILRSYNAHRHTHYINRMKIELLDDCHLILLIATIIFRFTLHCDCVANSSGGNDKMKNKNEKS